MSMCSTVTITVIEAWGSTPREAGTAMQVNAERTTGTIGGGALEWRAINHARELLGGADVPTELDLPLGPALAQCCGGRVKLRFKIDQVQPAAATDLTRLHLYGLGHVGEALNAALAPLPFDVTCYDERPAMLQKLKGQAAHAHYKPLAKPGDFHLVMTHSHQIDLEIVTQLLKTNEFGFLGLIGSATKRARFERSLRAQGITQEQLNRLVCPIGINGITDKAPPVIAACVTAQLLLAAEAYGLVGRNRQLVTAPE